MWIAPKKRNLESLITMDDSDEKPQRQQSSDVLWKQLQLSTQNAIEPEQAPNLIGYLSSELDTRGSFVLTRHNFPQDTCLCVCSCVSSSHNWDKQKGFLFPVQLCDITTKHFLLKIGKCSFVGPRIFRNAT